MSFVMPVKKSKKQMPKKANKSRNMSPFSRIRKKLIKDT